MTIQSIYNFPQQIIPYFGVFVVDRVHKITVYPPSKKKGPIHTLSRPPPQTNPRNFESKKKSGTYFEPSPLGLWKNNGVSIT